MHFFTNDLIPIEMPRQVFLAHFDPVVTRFGAQQSQKKGLKLGQFTTKTRFKTSQTSVVNPF